MQRNKLNLVGPARPLLAGDSCIVGATVVFGGK